MLVTLAVVIGLTWLWQRRFGTHASRGPRIAVAAAAVVGLVAAAVAGSVASRLPAASTMTDHGSEHAGHTGTDISTLTGPRDRTPDVRHTLTAGTARVRLTSGETIDAWTFDHPARPGTAGPPR